MSMYAVFSSERSFDDFTLGSYLGFGTGNIGYDGGLDTTAIENKSSAGVFWSY